MYTSFYNLSERPFQISTDPRFLWLGAKHEEALAILKYGLIGEKGFLLLTGDVGVGKTTLVNALLKDLNDDVFIANVTDPNLDLMGFLNHVARSFNILQQFDKKEEFLLYFRSFLQTTCSDNKLVLLIIDEAHKLSKELLEQIRLLSNIELPEKKLITIFFVGQNELNQMLKSRDCRALRQRITLNYNIKPLSETETFQYIKHRLKVAGIEGQLFNKKAIRDIHRFSEGYPRIINMICDRALLNGYVKDQKKITPDIILESSQEVLLPGETKEDLFFNFPKSLRADSQTSSFGCPSIRKDCIAFQETWSSGRPLREPKTVNGGVNSKDQTGAKCIVESALRPKRRGLIYRALAASLLIITMAFLGLSYKYLFLRSDKQKPASRGFNATAPIESDVLLSSPYLATPHKKAVTPLKDEVINASAAVQSVSAKLSSLEQAKKTLAKKNFSRAVELLEDAMAHKGENQPEVKALYIQALRGQAGILLTKDTDQTKKLLYKAIKADSQSAMVHYDLGKLYYQTKDYSKAIDAYSKAAHLNPGSANTFFNLGFTYASIKDYVNAEKMFLHTTELKPPYLDKAIFNLALVQYKQGKKLQCVENLEKALKLNPDNQRVRKYLERFTGVSGVPQ